MKEGWTYKKLGDLFPICMGKTPPRANAENWDEKKETHNLWVSIADLSANEGKEIIDTKEYVSDIAAKNIRKVQKGSLLFSFKLSIGKMAFAGKDLYTNEAIIALPERKDINKYFLHYYLLSLNWDDIAGGNEKIKGKTLNKGSLSLIPIACPTVSEQERIVAYLDTQFAKIDTMKANAAKALAEAKALFQSALTEAMTPKEGWKEKTLGEIAEIKGGKRVPKGYSLETIPTKHKYIRVADFTNYGTVSEDDIHYINDEVYEQIKRYIIKKEDIYLSIAGTIGKTGIIPDSLDGANLTENACRLILTNIIDQKYLYYQTKSKYFVSCMKQRTIIAAQPKLAITRLATIPVYFPDIPEQERIVTRLDALSAKVAALEANYTQTVAECDALKQALLREVFE